MGMEICDPERIEGNIERLPGLGLLPTRTILESDKVTRQVQFRFLDSEAPCKGYEIHNGQTVREADSRPLNSIEDDGTDGCFADDRCFGSYIHGLLDNPTVIDFLLRPYLKEKSGKNFDYTAYKEEQYDLLAAHLRKHIDIDRLYSIMERK